MDVDATMTRQAIAGGVWQLVTSDGRTFQVVDPPDGLTRQGMRVHATIELARDIAGIGVTAPYVRVTRWVPV